MSDWLPTLLSAAGGDADDLGTDLDGLDQWEALSRGAEAPRKVSWRPRQWQKLT